MVGRASSDTTPKSFPTRSSPADKSVDLLFILDLRSFFSYRCEISADAPSFGIVYSDQKMSVVGWYIKDWNEWMDGFFLLCSRSVRCEQCLQRSAWKSIWWNIFSLVAASIEAFQKLQRNAFTSERAGGRKKTDKVNRYFELYWIFSPLISSLGGGVKLGVT